MVGGWKMIHFLSKWSLFYGKMVIFRVLFCVGWIPEAQRLTSMGDFAKSHSAGMWSASDSDSFVRVRLWFSWHFLYVKCWKLDEIGMLSAGDWKWLQVSWVESVPSLWPPGCWKSREICRSGDLSDVFFWSLSPFLAVFLCFRVEKTKIFRDPATESRNLLSRSQWRSRARCDPKSFTRTHRVVLSRPEAAGACRRFVQWGDVLRFFFWRDRICFHSRIQLTKKFGG